MGCLTFIFTVLPNQKSTQTKQFLSLKSESFVVVVVLDLFCVSSAESSDLKDNTASNRESAVASSRSSSLC